jgi:hypothetical protein
MPVDEDLGKMDRAAVEAQFELQQDVHSWSAYDLMDWWSRWYLKAGHKRLGRILVKLAGRT